MNTVSQLVIERRLASRGGLHGVCGEIVEGFEGAGPRGVLCME